MTFIGQIREATDRVAGLPALDVDAAGLAASVRGLDDAALTSLLSDAASVVQGWQMLQAVVTGVVAERSARSLGHTGLAAKGGFRTPTEMVRVLTGVSKAEATRAVKVGESLVGPAVDFDVLSGVGDDSSGSTDAVGGAARVPWHEPLRVALLEGGLTQAQYDAIFRGLGEPPARDDADAEMFAAAWSAAACELIGEASSCTVEMLGDQARTLRDLLDEEGAQERLRAAYEARSLRMWRGPDGCRRATIAFDPEGGEWFDSVLSAALRPRRGGPRFVSDAERAAADELAADPRSNEQLAYDLVFDLLRAGALAEAKDVCGTRAPGVRLIVVKDAVTGPDVHRDPFGRLLAVAHTEDARATVDGAAIERALCVGGAVEVTVDSCGRPLDVGREARLFTPAQRIALAARDGGCMWPGCDRPPAMTEAHHCTPWSEGGCTDIDDGVSLCAFHHVELHFRGWAVENDGQGRFLLFPPPGAGADALRGMGTLDAECGAIVLRSRSALRWLWDPPPDRVGWRTDPAAVFAGPSGCPAWAQSARDETRCRPRGGSVQGADGLG